MEGFLEFIGSVNKLILFAFLCVFFFLIYEISLLRKEKMKKQKPIIPQFNANATPISQVPTAAQVTINSQNQNAVTSITAHQNLNPFLIMFVGLVCIATIIVTIYLFVMKKKTNTLTQTTEPIVTEVQSKGLKIYDLKWSEIPSAKFSSLHPGDTVYIALETIPEADIDRARIKVNENEWNIKHITMQYNAEKKMYYKEYVVATGESRLKIDAQLHSATDGWLGD